MVARDDLLARLIEHVEGRYYGKYRGHVSNNDDPTNIGRIRATVPRLLGDKETGWALPAFAYGGLRDQGLYAVPEVGAGVWIEFEGGDLSYPIWTGTWYDRSESLPEGATPGKKVFKTSTGHKVVLDDDGKSVAVVHADGNTVTLDETGIKVTVTSGQRVVIDAPAIQLVQGASHPLVFGDALMEYLEQLVNMYMTHTHPGELAAGMFPVTPMLPVPPLNPPLPSMLSMRVTTD